MADSKASSSKPQRPGWDKEQWASKAKERDAHFASQAKEADAAMQKGRKYRIPKDDEDQRKPSELENAKQRTEDVDYGKNLNKTMLVQTSTTGKGPRGPGFYCDLCNETLKDSLSFLDHLNGRFHLRKLGQNTFQTRSTLGQVRAKIAALRASTAEKTTAANFDFQKRLQAIKDAEQVERDKRKEDRKRKRAERREEESLGKLGLQSGATAKDVEKAQEQQDDMAAMMGFGGFTGKRKK